MRCFKCQGIGHLQADCPNRKAIMYTGDQLIELNNDDKEPEDNHQEEDDGDGDIEPDEGELLVIQRSLHADLKKKNHDSEMHSSIPSVLHMARCA